MRKLPGSASCTAAATSPAGKYTLILMRPRTFNGASRRPPTALSQVDVVRWVEQMPSAGAPRLLERPADAVRHGSAHRCSIVAPALCVGGLGRLLNRVLGV